MTLYTNISIQLPNENCPVLAGILTKKIGAAAFRYDNGYLSREDAIPLDPLNLPLQDVEQTTVLNDGMFGIINDALPDNWGRQVLSCKIGVDRCDINDTAMLLHTSNERTGALNFGQSPDSEQIPTIDDLEPLCAAADDLFNGDHVDKRLLHKLWAGTSMGGARPKSTVLIDGELWLAKFPSPMDKQNISRIEYATMTLAGRAGIDIPQVKVVQVGGMDIFLIKRFDRETIHGETTKRHFCSALTTLAIDQLKMLGQSYQGIAAKISKFCYDPQRQAKKLYRRMVFNVFCHNVDDHLKNHGFLLTKQGWQLSPAYDIVSFGAMPGLDFHLCLGIGQQGTKANVSNLLSDTESFNITNAEANGIIDDVRQAVSGWQDIFAGCGVSQADREYLAHSLNRFLL